MRTCLAKLVRYAFPTVVLFLAACSGETPTPITSYSVGGTLTGLTAGNSITLTNNGTDNLTLNADGAFAFPVKLANAASYNLTISVTTPTIQSCAPSFGSGVINASNVTALKVTCSIASTEVIEAAGLVQFVVGEVQRTSPAGQKLAVHKGDAVNEGDTLSSGQNASARIRMRDGGVITMRADSRFRIDSFKFNGKQDGSEQSFYSLINGGFRSVTGLIGKLHKNNYLIATSYASIGIRGTDHEAYLVLPDSPMAKQTPVGVYDKVNSGATILTNDKGTIAILPKQMGYVAAPDQKPVLQPVNAKLFAVEAEPSYPFDGRWATKLVCEDTNGPKGTVKGYTWEFDVTIEHGQLNGQYGEPGKPSSGTYVGQVQNDGTADINVQGLTGKTDYTVGKVARGTPFDYPMTGKFSGSTGHATRTKLRPCEATFTKQQEKAK